MTVLVLATGGTIASARDENGMFVPARDAAELLAGLPADLDLPPIEIETLGHVSGWNMTPEAMLEVAQTARSALTTGRASGIVVTHGTDTIEETLFLTELLAGEATARGPIVFTGSMRGASELSADGPRNLANALAVASHPEAVGRGAMLTLNDTIHAARWVSKANTLDVATFRSWPAGPVGEISDGEPGFHALPPPRPQSGSSIESDVVIVKVYSGMSDQPLHWFVDSGVAGIVLEGTGAGNVPGTSVPGIVAALEQEIPVVITSQCREGRASSHYGGPGGGRALDHMGVIRAGYLNSNKARIALMVGLGCTTGLDELRAWFDDAGF